MSEQEKADYKELIYGIINFMDDEHFSIAVKVIDGLSLFGQDSKRDKAEVIDLLSEEKVTYSNFYRLFKKKAFIHQINKNLAKIDSDNNAGIVGYSMFVTVGKLNESNSFETFVSQDFVHELEEAFKSENGFFVQGLRAQAQNMAEYIVELASQGKSESERDKAN